MNYASLNPEAVDKVTIRVIIPDILISNVGDGKDFFIELTNNTNDDADISQWILISDRINFTFPKNTILGAKKKMLISPTLSRFDIEDKNSLKLMTPQREVVYDFIAQAIRKVITKTSIPASLPKEENQNKNIEISAENLSAAAILGDAKKNNFRSYIPLGVLILFLGFTSSAVYFIRQKKSLPKAGDDFELLDE